jgi:hypothetical protein
VLYSDAGSYEPNTRSVSVRTVLALGDAELKLTAGGNIDLATAGNPTLWTQSQDQVGSTGNRSYFSTSEYWKKFQEIPPSCPEE